jgi:hypothetical protein
MTALNDRQRAIVERAQIRMDESKQKVEERGNRHLGLAGRVGVEGAVSGVLGLPALAYDGTIGVLENAGRRAANLGVLGYNAVTGNNVEEFGYRDPFATTGAVMRAGQMGADALGLPAPETPGERLAVEGGRGAVSALTGVGAAGALSNTMQTVPRAFAGIIGGPTQTGSGFLPTLANAAKNPTRSIQDGLRTLATAPVTQVAAGTGAGAGGEYVGQSVENANIPDWVKGGARVAGSIAGGVTGALTPVALLGAGHTLRELWRPFTQKGKEEVVGGALRQTATDPDAAITRGLTGRGLSGPGAREIVPGSKPTLGQATSDPGLLGIENPIRSMDTQGRFATRIGQNNAARNQAIDGITRPPATVDMMKSNLDSWTDDVLNRHIFPNKRAIPIQSLRGVEDTVLRISKSPEGVQTSVRNAMRLVNGELQKLAGQGRATDPEYLYSLRKNLQQIAEGRFSNPNVKDMALAKGQIYQVIRSIDDAIETGAGGFKNYMNQYASKIKEIESFRTVNDIRSMSRLSVPDPVTGLDIISPSYLRNAVEGRAKELGKKLTPTQQRVLSQVVKDLNRSQAANAATVRVPNSATFQNLSIANLFGRLLGSSIDVVPMPFQKTLNLIYKIPSQRMEEMLIEAVLDPHLGIKLMQNATPKRAISTLTEMVRRFGSGSMRTAAETGTGNATDD